MAWWRRRCTEDGEDGSLGLPRWERMPAEAVRHGWSGEDHGVDGACAVARGVEVAAAFSGVLRGSDASTAQRRGDGGVRNALGHKEQDGGFEMESRRRWRPE